MKKYYWFDVVLTVCVIAITIALVLLVAAGIEEVSTDPTLEIVGQADYPVYRFYDAGMICYVVDTNLDCYKLEK